MNIIYLHTVTAIRMKSSETKSEKISKKDFKERVISRVMDKCWM